MGGWLEHCLDEFSEGEEEEEGEEVGVGVEHGGMGVGNEGVGGEDGHEKEIASVFRFETGVGLGTTSMEHSPRLSEYSQKSGPASEVLFGDPPGAQDSIDIPLSLPSEDSTSNIPPGGGSLSPGGGSVSPGGSTSSTHPHLSSELAAAEVPLAPFLALPPKR